METLDIRLTLKHPVKVIPWRNNNFSIVEKEAPLSENVEIFIGVYLLVLGWLSVLGNSVVILVLYRQRLVLQPTDLLTVSLAVSDAAIAVLGYSRGVVEVFNLFRDDGYITTWIWTCQVNGFLTLIFGLASMNTLTVVSVTRYIKGCHSSKAYCLSKSTISISIICAWIGALFWSMVSLLGWGSYTDRGYGTCDVDWSKANYSTIYKSFIVSVLVCCFIIPVLLMLFCFTSLINTAKTRSALSADTYFSERQRKVDRDVTRVSVAICTAFMLAWFPYVVVSTHAAWGVPVPGAVGLFARLLAKSSCFYNPFIYLAMSPKFRRDIAALLPCSREAKDVVHLQHFKHLKPKSEAAAAVEESLCSQKGHVHQTKLELVVEDKDSGVISPLQTPPATSAPSHKPLMPESESDRL